MVIKLLKALFLFFLVFSVVYVVGLCYLHFTYKDKMNDLITSSKDISYSSQSISDEIIDLEVESLDGDQVVQEVTSGVKVLRIPNLNIEVPLLKGTDDETLKLGAGIFDSSTELGTIGNFAIAGHSSSYYNAIFNGLEQGIQYLDKLEVTDEYGNIYNYYVTDIFKTSPQNMSVLMGYDKPIMTIVTCTEKAVSRLIVVGELLGDEEYNNLLNKKNQVYKENMLNIVSSYKDLDILQLLNDEVYISKYRYRVRYYGVSEYNSGIITINKGNNSSKRNINPNTEFNISTTK